MEPDAEPPRPRYLDGDKLRLARIAEGMGQAELAAKAGTTQTQITHYENGDWGCHLPRLRDLAEALNRKPADLMHADALAPKPARRPRKAKTPAEAKQQAKAA